MIVGLGMTGLSCARFLASRGEPFLVADSREKPPCLEEFRSQFGAVPVELGPFQEDSFVNATQLIVSPGVSLSTPAIVAAKHAGIPITGDIDLFSTLAEAPIVAVTGSNGKSTVVSLVAAIFEEAGWNYGLGGNLDGERARPALELLMGPPSDVYILELSSFQLETTRHLNAEVAAILNLSQDHMDRYENMEAYLEAKRYIFRGARQVVVNSDCAESMPPPGDARIWRYGIGDPVHSGFGLIREDGIEQISLDGRPLLAVNELKLAGIHNVSNVLAAMTIGHAMGLPTETIVRAVSRFPGLPHRCEWVREIGGVHYYNDSKGTNVGASVAAIQGLGTRCDGSLVLIAGGEGKGADFSPLVPVVSEFVSKVVLIGAAARQLDATLSPVAETIHAEDMSEAVSRARAGARPGDIVLLSPACASFDMFDDFTHRGRVYMAAVRSLK